MKSFDAQFVEVENSRMVYYGVAETLTSNFLSKCGANGPNFFENEFTLLNINNVSSISLVREK